MALKSTIAASLILLVSFDECRGAFILDDFNVGFSLEFPNESDFGNITSRHMGVGDIADTRRWTNVFDRRMERATLKFEANPIVNPTAIIDVVRIPPRTGGLEHSSFTTSYLFLAPGQECPLCPLAQPRTVDLTENGINDTVFIDFAFVRGPTPPKTIRLDATNPGTYSIAFIRDIQVSEEPFTVAVPFSEFRDRGGETTPHDFSTSSSFAVSVFTSGLFDLDTYDPNFVERFTIGIDAIRIGAVPEPGTGVLWGSCLLGIACLRRKWRRRKRGR